MLCNGLNILTKNGGYADDIWISRGYFNPNIEKVRITNIKSENRIDFHRATISFSGLAKMVEIENADIYRLECEETSTGLNRWEFLPRKDDIYAKSKWSLNQINADYIDIAVKGKAIEIDAKNLYSKVSFGVYQVGGSISDSTFHKGDEPRLIRLDDLTFTNVIWLLTSNKCTHIMHGLRPASDEDDPCIVHFINNQFKVKEDMKDKPGALITSEYSATHPLNRVEVSLIDCKYDERFGSDDADYLETHVIIAKERGNWTIKISDFGSRNIDRALPVYDFPDVNIIRI